MKDSRVFYGWRIVGVAFLADFFAVGFLFYSFSVFLKPLAVDFDATREAVALVLTLSFLSGSVAAPFLGRTLDRFRVRNIMIAGAFCTAAGYALTAGARSLTQVYLTFALLVGLGAATMGGLSSATLVSNWFVARRGTALGVATIGISLSGFVMPTVATALIGWVGWRGAYLLFAVVTLLCVIPPVALVVVNRPEALGLEPDGAPPPDPGTTRKPSGERVWSTREIFRNRQFWLIALCFAFAFFATSGVLVHLVSYATDLGIDEYRAAACLSVAAGFATAAKFVFGYLVDRVSPRLALSLCFATQLAGVVGISQSSAQPGLFASAALFGFGFGGMVPIQGALTGEIFGRLSYGKVAGLMRPVQTPLHILGPPLAGRIYDATRSYELAFAIFAAAYCLALLAVLRLRAR